MSSTDAMLSTYSLIKLLAAVWLFSHTLPRRNHFPLRFSLVLSGCVILLASGVAAGFSVFPPLADAYSFARAILSFVGVLALAVVAQSVIFDNSPRTSLFCCSMAYALENASSAADRLFVVSCLGHLGDSDVLLMSTHYWAIAAVVYGVAYATLVRHMEKSGLTRIDDPVLLLATVTTFGVNIILDLIIKDLGVLEIPAHYQAALTVIYLCLCAYIMYSEYEMLYARRLELDVAAIEHMRSADAKQYELSKRNIDAINIKCHDIRHQIRHLKKSGAMVDQGIFNEIAREVDVYDSAVKSGNGALDTIITEKSLLCERNGITLSCIADGSTLDFMRPADLYSFFGNALENAFEAVERLGDPERRSISLDVRRRGDMAVIHIENYFDGKVHLDEDGLPLTSKGDTVNHGLGTTSMRLIIESYGGTLSVVAKGDTFHLSALVPIPG